MMNSSEFEYLKSKYDDRIKELSSFLAQGTVKDIGEYQRICGVIQGLNTANELLLDLAKRLETDADE
jgi:hypothetical protein